MAMIRLICRIIQLLTVSAKSKPQLYGFLFIIHCGNRQPNNKAKVSGYARWTIIEPAWVDFCETPVNLKPYPEHAGYVH